MFQEHGATGQKTSQFHGGGEVQVKHGVPAENWGGCNQRRLILIHAQPHTRCLTLWRCGCGLHECIIAGITRGLGVDDGWLRCGVALCILILDGHERHEVGELVDLGFVVPHQLVHLSQLLNKSLHISASCRCSVHSALHDGL